MSATAMGRPNEHAVVVGGSMAGLIAARALAPHYKRVTVLERDRLPENADPRKGTPQARHIHVLLTAGRRALEELFPGLMNELVAAGAVDYDAVNDMEWVNGSGIGIRYKSGIMQLGATRDLIEWGVRRRVLSDSRISVRQEIDVSALHFDEAKKRVTGWALNDRANGVESEELAADLVVDASGRGSRVPQWLEANGYERPRETVVNGFLGYASRLVRPPANWKSDWKTFYIQCAPPKWTRGGVIATVEGGRWIVTVAGGGKDYPPTDENGFRSFARSLRDKRLAEAYEASEPLTPIVGTKTTENRVRHYEELKRMPEALLVTGDAVCGFNPVYAQGMSTAAVGGQTLAACLADKRRSVAELATTFQAKLAKGNTRAWLLATGEDYRYEQAEGPKPGRATLLAHRYLDRVFALATRVPAVRQRLMEVIHLVRPPSSLFAPSILARAAFTRIPVTA